MDCCPDGVRCSHCRKVQPSAEYYSDRSKRHGHATTCKTCMKARSAERVANPLTRAAALAYMSEYGKRPEVVAKRKQREAEDRARVLALYGGRCACCGEAEPAFLTLDHINDDGAEHRAEDSLAASIIRWHRRNGFARSDRFQLLCWNCNCTKGILGGCPHETQRKEVRP